MIDGFGAFLSGLDGPTRRALEELLRRIGTGTGGGGGGGDSFPYPTTGYAVIDGGSSADTGLAIIDGGLSA